MGRLFLLFILVPIVELMLLIKMGQVVGLLPTLGLILVTGFAGAWLARREGFRAFSRFTQTMARGEIPADAALDGIAVLIGGAFLLTPGVLTDLVGFSLLLPPVRSRVKRRLVEAAKRGIEKGTMRVHMSGMGGVAGMGAWSAGTNPRDPGGGGPGSQGGSGGPDAGPGRGSGPGARPLARDPREIVVPHPDEVD